jgi:hypothetical protein
MAKQAGARGQRGADPKKTRPRKASLLLEAELGVFEAHLPGWVEREGQHVLIKGEEIVGFFPTREEALVDGYTRFGIVPFLVKQIAQNEPVYTLAQVDL